MIHLEESERSRLPDRQPRWPEAACPDLLETAPGIRVLNRSQVAAICGMSRWQLQRLERSGRWPRRRRGGDGAGSAHARPPGARRQARRHGRTVTRWVRDAVLPPPRNGRWLEREVDAWLLKRPRV